MAISSRRKGRRRCAPRRRRLVIEAFEPRQLLASAPFGTDKTVTTLEDTACIIAASDFGFTDTNDSPPDHFIAVKIASLSAHGSLTDNNVAVTAGQIVPVGDVTAGKLQFVPAANANGTAYAAFGFQVQDDGDAAAGGSNLDPSPNTLSINVTPVNDPPYSPYIGTEAIISSGSTYTFSAAFGLSDWNFGDPNDSPPNSFLAIKIDSLPIHGSLTYNNAPATVGQFITTADLLAGKLKCTPPVGAAGFQYDSFSYQLQDDGGTANGGGDLSAIHSYSFDVVARSPAGKDTAVNLSENQFYVFSGSDFFPGPDAVPPIYNLTAVKIDSLPAIGSLTDNGVPVAVSQFIPAADITAGKLRYTPPPNSSGMALAKFNFQVQDDGGTFDNRQDVDPTANSITLIVAPLNHVNQPPSGTDKTFNLFRNATQTFAASDFGFSDNNEIPSNSFLAVKIIGLPVAGSLTDNGAAVAAGQFIPVADLNAGKLQFAPATDASGVPYTTIVFEVEDDGGTANGGVDVDPTPNIITLNVSTSTANHAPTAQNGAINALEDTDYTFQLADFGFSDPLDVPANSLLAVKVISGPTAGFLSDNGLGFTSGRTVPAADIVAGTFKFLRGPADSNGTPYAFLTFQVQDDGGTAGGGVDTSPTANTLTINVLSINDPPTTPSRTIGTANDTPYTFSTADFSVSDPHDNPQNTLLAVKVTALPAAGLLTDNGAALALNAFVSAADITASKFVFTPAAGGTGQPYAQFGFQVQDNGGTANGGVDLSGISSIFVNVGVTAVNHAPAGTDKSLTVSESQTHSFTAADFGFADPNDFPPNNLLAVKISSLPPKGTLADNGAAVTAGQLIAVSDLAAGKLSYTPAAFDFSFPSTSFQFQVQDDGGTAGGGSDLDPTPNTITVNVQPVNHPPGGQDGNVNWQSSAAYTFSIFDFGFFDLDTPTNGMAAVKITTLPAPATSGTLNLGSSPVSAGQFISVSSINAGQLRFTPAAGNPYAAFTFQVQDNGGTFNGGVDLDPTPNTFSFGIAPYPPPNGSNTALTMLEDGSYAFATTDFYIKAPFQNDPPGHGSPTPNLNNLLNVKVVTLPTTGGLMNDGVAVPVNSSVSAADIVAGKLRYTPPANANGTGLATFAFQVQDDGGLTNGRSDVDPTPNTIMVNVTPVNDPPVASDRTVQVGTTTTRTLSMSDFPLVDANDLSPLNPSGPNALASVTIIGVNLAGAGVLTFNGAPVSASLPVVIATSDLTAGKLQFTAGSGAGLSASFTFRIQDNGGTASGGIDIDPIIHTMTLPVGQGPNQAPSGSDHVVTAWEDVRYVFQASDFGFADPDGNNFRAVKITTTPASGLLTLNGASLAAGQAVFVNDINNGLFRFVQSAPNANGAALASFTFQVQDDGGTLNGGVDLDPSPDTLTINVTPVNDLPSGTDNVINPALNGALVEDSRYMFAAADFGFNDVLDSPADSFLSVKITTLPASGTLLLKGAPVAPGQEALVSDIGLGGLVYQPPANANGAALGVFSFQVRDSGGTANGGIDLDPTPNTMTLNVTPVNDAPTGVDGQRTINEDNRYVFTSSDFPLSDPNDQSPPSSTPPNSLASVIVTSMSLLGGTLTVSGQPIALGTVISATSIQNGQFQFTPPVNFNSGSLGIRPLFTFQVRDNGGTAFGGADTSANSNTLTFNVTPVNDAPQGVDKTITILEDQIESFSAADFPMSDFADSPQNNLLAVKISSLPTRGSLFLNFNNPVTVGQTIAYANLSALSFVPSANANGSAYAAFTFQVEDDGGTANGGADTDFTPNTITFNVTPVNDAPIGMNGTVTTPEDTTYVLKTTDFGFTDPNDQRPPSNGPGDPNSLASVRFTTLPSAAQGTLTLGGSPLTVGQLVSASAIASGSLNFRANPNLFGPALTNFTFQLQDNGGTANGGIDLESALNAHTLTFNVTAVNDPPVGLDARLTTSEDTPYAFRLADFGFFDPVDFPNPNNFVAVKIEFLPISGVLRNQGNPVSAGQMIARADIDAGNFTYTPNANQWGSPLTSFAFRVKDDGGTLNGGVDTAISPNTMTVTVLPVNDAPIGTSGTVTALAGNAYTVHASDFGFSDPNDSPPNAFKNVIITAASVAAGSLTLAGSPIAAASLPLVVSKASLDAGLLQYQAPLTSPQTLDSFQFRVQDDGGTANLGLDVDFFAKTLTFNIFATANHEPSGIDHTIQNAIEDTAYVFSLADFPFSDGDQNTQALQSIKISTLPGLGALTLFTGTGFSAVNVGQFISASDIFAGKFRYQANPNASGLPYASFTFQVQDNGGTAIVAGVQGVDLDLTPNTQTISVFPVNDAPRGTSSTIAIASVCGQIPQRTLSVADFGFIDPLDSPANSLSAVRVTFSGDGTLTINGSAVAPGTVVSRADLNAGHLVYTPPQFLEPNVATISFQVQDDGGTAFGGVDIDPTLQVLTFSLVAAPNRPPVGANHTVFTTEDTAYVFSTGDFPFSDSCDGNRLNAVIVASVPAHGTLLDGGSVIVALQTIPLAQISGGRLRFVPDANGNGFPYASFDFQVQDDGGTVFGGVDLDPTPRTMTVNVTPVNDPPVCSFGPIPPTTDESGQQTIVHWASCSPGPPDEAGQQLQFSVQTTMPQLFAVLPAVDSQGTLTFTPAPNAHGQAMLSIVAQDDGGTAIGGLDRSLPAGALLTVNKPHPWHNTKNPLDVDGDGHVAPRDALLVINAINASGGGQVPDSAAFGPPYCDVDGDNVVAPIDALMIINYINGEGVNGEGPEGGGQETTGQETREPETGRRGTLSDPQLLALLAADVAGQPRKQR